MADSLQYTHARFAVTIMRVMGVFALLFSVLMIGAHYHFGTTLEKMNLAFSIPAFVYLSFIMGWAIAYTKFYKFPANQKVLILGVIIAALIMPIFGGFSHLLSDQIEIAELHGTIPEVLFGSFIGAIMQLYFMVIGLRYIFKRRLPF